MSEQQVFAKCAWRLIPFMGLLLLMNSIDRTNVGFAALTMNKDLGFSPAVFGLGAGVFFIGYALFQLPANVLLRRIGARRWVFCISALWSVLSTLNAFIQSPMSFYAVRFFLGVAEADFFPGMLLYLTYWFPRTLLAHYTAYFTLAVPLSFVVGGPLASLFLGFDGVASIHGWQWLFLIEGVPAFFLAFAVLKFLPDGPVDASWLTPGEKHSIALYLAAAEPQGPPIYGQPCAIPECSRWAYAISRFRGRATVSCCGCRRWHRVWASPIAQRASSSRYALLREFPR
jgi:MFS transporter, ACS family, tartrate transporter